MIAVGNNNIQKAYLGEKIVSYIYLGNNKLFTKLPYDAEIEYLESDGYQLIDTGLSAPANTSFEARLAVVDNSFTSGLIGTRASTVISSSSYNIFIINSKVRIDLIGNGQVYVDISQGVPFEIEYTPNKTIVNGVTNANAVTKADCSYPFYLFNFNNNGDGVYAEQGTPQRLYSFKLWHGDILVRDFIPVRIKTEGCLYDKVEKKIYKNEGTGTFVLGADK